MVKASNKKQSAEQRYAAEAAEDWRRNIDRLSRHFHTLKDYTDHYVATKSKAAEHRLKQKEHDGATATAKSETEK